MPRRRKRPKYLPEISVLLRNAQELTVAELGEPDARKRRERERDRDLAITRLREICRDPKELRQLSQLDRASVLNFCELLKDRNCGQPPKGKGGRPTDEERRLLVAVCLEEAIEEVIKRRGRKHGSKEEAFKKIADRDDLFNKRRRSSKWATRYEYVKEIYYDTDPDFRREVAVEMELRRRKIHGKG